MGFELDRLMKQFGVATPSLNYSGTGVPIDPGTRPVATEALKGDDLAASQARYDNLLSKYNIDKANYPADQALYNTYKTEYQNRLLGTPQYMMAQFQTGNEPKSAGYQWATRPDVNVDTGSGMGLKQYNTNIQNYATQNPTANTAAINAYADKYGISAQDIYNATNNRWGNTLQVPKYGTLTPTVTAPIVTTPTTITTGSDVVTTPTVTTPTVTTPTVTTPTVETPLTILSKPIISDIPDEVDTNIPIITAPDILETIPSIYTKPIVSDIPDTVDTNIPLIIPETPLGLPDFTVLPSPDEDFPPTLRKDVSFWDDSNAPDLVGPTRGQPELDESFDKYLVTDTPAVTNTPDAVGNGTTGGIQDAINDLNDKYEVQDWENLNNSGNFDGTMAGDFSLNSDKNTYLGNDGFNLDGSYDFRGSDYDSFGGFGGGGMGGGGKYFDDQSMATMAMAKGGQVKTHYNDGGPLRLPSRTVRSSDAFQVMGQPQDPSQFAAADAYNDILRNRVIADTQSGRANDPMYGVADARQLEARANTPERGFGPLVAQRELLNRSNEGEFAAAGYGDLGQFAGSFDPANVPMGDNRYSPADQYRMIARDASIVDGSAPIMPRDGGRAARANLMGDSDDGRYAVAGYGDLGQFIGGDGSGGYGGFGGMGGGKFGFDEMGYATMAMAKGGAVKTHFQTGGANQPSEIDQMAENYGVGPQPDIMSYQGSKLFPMQATAPVSNLMTRRDAYPPTPQSPMDARATQLDALLQRYAGDSTDYSSELEKARKTADTESMAFQKMIQEAMKGSADAAPSKAEMYFRLASAFGSPTKTGNFAESLSNVNKELAAYSKDERDAKKAQRALQLQMGLEGQKMRMSSAKDDLTTLRSLASEEMKSKRAITTEIIKDFIKSGEPESAAGKQAKDEGLKVGTPEFKARVNEIAQTSVDAKLAQVTATLAGMSVQQANANLAIQKFQNLQEQQSKLTPAEVALKTQTEDMLGSTTQAMEDLKRAYVLNPNTFDASLPDTAQRKLLEAAGSKDPKLANTREQINLLEKGALAQLKSTFPGAISDAETRTLKELQGINAKSIEERARIMRNAFRALKAIDERSKRRLADIRQGTYRDTTPTPEGLE